MSQPHSLTNPTTSLYPLLVRMHYLFFPAASPASSNRYECYIELFKRDVISYTVFETNVGYLHNASGAKELHECILADGTELSPLRTKGYFVKCALSLMGAFDRESEDEGLEGLLGACEELIRIVREEKQKERRVKEE
jgi:hypothetical protein